MCSEAHYGRITDRKNFDYILFMTINYKSKETENSVQNKKSFTEYKKEKVVQQEQSTVHNALSTHGIIVNIGCNTESYIFVALLQDELFPMT